MTKLELTEDAVVIFIYSLRTLLATEKRDGNSFPFFPDSSAKHIHIHSHTVKVSRLKRRKRTYRRISRQRASHKKERKSVRGQGIIATRRGDRADARDWTRNIIVSVICREREDRGGRAEATQWRKGHLIERGLQGETCGLKGFEVTGRQGGRICGS